MKAILYMAMSLNGFIAREDGDEDFLSEENWNSFCELAKNSKGFIVGRKTYEAVEKWTDGYTFKNVDSLRIVVSSNPDYKLKEGFSLAHSIVEALNIAKKNGLKEVIVTGGSILNSSFLKSNLIDEIILNIEPFVLGKGIRIFSDDDFENKLELNSIKELPLNIVQLHYLVKK